MAERLFFVSCKFSACTNKRNVRFFLSDFRRNCHIFVILLMPVRPSFVVYFRM